MQVSVIICAHNPRSDYMTRVIDALRIQTLAPEQWELILVDNASAEPLSERFDLSSFPNWRHVREDELGLTAARLRGIAEAKTDLLIFVDDDNVVDPEFLSEAILLGTAYPFLGAWGGTIRPEFEVEPHERLKPFLGNLAIRTCAVPVWSMDMQSAASQPCGAGLCVRSSVAKKYRDDVLSDPVRRQLFSTGDTDLVFTAADNGLGWGTFPNLALTHLLPKARLTETYTLRLIEGLTTTATAMALKRQLPTHKAALSARFYLRMSYLFLRRGLWETRLAMAHARGVAAGHRLVSKEKL
jgi:glycosyltransferase involved in cell wall biosynthesis